MYVFSTHAKLQSVSSYNLSRATHIYSQRPQKESEWPQVCHVLDAGHSATAAPHCPFPLQSSATAAPLFPFPLESSATAAPPFPFPLPLEARLCLASSLLPDAFFCKHTQGKVGASVYFLSHKPFFLVQRLLSKTQIWAISCSLSLRNKIEVCLRTGGPQEVLKSCLQVGEVKVSFRCAKQKSRLGVRSKSLV
jgi:hypothetical protein